jgi:hypothetical protein
LQWEYVLSIKILVQAIEIVRNVLQQQRCGLVLPSRMTTLQKRGVIVGKLRIMVQQRVPTIGNVCKPWIERCSQTLNDCRQWIRKIAVLAPPKPMTPHDHAASKSILEIIQSGYFAAFLRTQYSRRARNPVLFELASQR